LPGGRQNLPTTKTGRLNSASVGALAQHRSFFLWKRWSDEKTLLLRALTLLGLKHAHGMRMIGCHTSQIHNFFRISDLTLSHFLNLSVATRAFLNLARTFFRMRA
jgi:hypothetical protein